METTYAVLDMTESSFTTKQSSRQLFLYGEIIVPKVNGILSYTPSEMNIFKEKYKIVETIYHNELAAGEVFLVEDIVGNKYAAKIYNKKKIKQQYLHDFLKNEISLHYFLSNLKQGSTIVKVHEYYEDHNSYNMIMEYSERPTFFDDMLENQYQAVQNEVDLQLYALDILDALKFVHENGVIHCDIKPQNFMWFRQDEENADNADTDTSYSEDPGKIKLSDFGLAHFVDPNTDKAYMKYRAGTMEYKAPEVKDDCYVDKSIDIWSFGVSLYKMAVAYFPTAFNRYKYGQGPIPYRKADWKDFKHREELQDLIDSCLKMDPKERITAQGALNHKWFSNLDN